MVQVISFLAMSPEELTNDINTFIKETEDIEVMCIDYITPIAPGAYGAYLTYHKLEWTTAHFV